MRSVLTIISDESLLNRIKLVLTDDSIDYSYALNADEASIIANSREIAVVILDYRSPIISGPELCEMLLSYNPDTQFVMLFDEKDTKGVLDTYNALHLNKLVCKEYLVLEDLPILIESCLYTYNRDEEIDKMDESYQKMNEMYLHPMAEMSSVLNERLTGYDNVIKVFRKSVDFVLNTSDEALKSIDEYVDRIINDYIQIFMIKEPRISVYFDRIHESFNDSEGRKYFKFVNEGINVPEELKYNLLFVLDVITIYFDIFYPNYRGKVTVSNVENNPNEIELNAIYEVRKNKSLSDIYSYIISAITNILENYTSNIKYGQRNSIIQYKAIIKIED